MLDLTRWAIVVEVELKGQEDLEESEKRYVSVAYRESFPSEQEARSFAEDLALAEQFKANGATRRIRGVVYTLRPVKCDCFYADEIALESPVA